MEAIFYFLGWEINHRILGRRLTYLTRKPLPTIPISLYTSFCIRSLSSLSFFILSATLIFRCFLNGDEPGNKAVAKYGPTFKAEYPNLKITSVAVPQHEDVNSLLQGHSPEILPHLIDRRKDFDFIFSNEEASQGTEITQWLSDEKEKSEQLKASRNGRDTTNPYN